MTFASFSFVIFFLVVFFSLLTMQHFNAKPTVKHAFLLVASYFFYGWWDWRFCFLILFVTVISYIASLKVNSKFWRVLGVALPLAVLGIFKYFNFFVSSFCSLFGLDASGIIRIILPVGISFYTFQSLSYVIDVIRGKQKPVSFLDLALYISFFPQLVAGPVVKAGDFMPQLKEDRLITRKAAERGIQIFIFGLFKKIVLADRLSMFVDEVFNAPTAFATPTILLAIFSYSLQIYLDFSGYSDMAIGSAKILGYDFLPNFNVPYLSQNLTEFWKRWHISLSTWLQEYLYFPLGGNRKGKVRTYINLMLTMVLGGLWHGANWTFVLWGALHGAGLCVHKFITRNKVKGAPSKKFFFTRGLCILSTYLFVCLCWVFFRAQNISTALIVLRHALTWQSGIQHWYIWSFFAILCVGIATLISKGKGFYPIFSLNTVKGWFILFFVLGLTLGLAYVGDNPFIYFQF